MRWYAYPVVALPGRPLHRCAVPAGRPGPVPGAQRQHGRLGTQDLVVLAVQDVVQVPVERLGPRVDRGRTGVPRDERGQLDQRPVRVVGQDIDKSRSTLLWGTEVEQHW